MAILRTCLEVQRATEERDGFWPNAMYNVVKAPSALRTTPGQLPLAVIVERPRVPPWTWSFARVSATHVDLHELVVHVLLALHDLHALKQDHGGANGGINYEATIL